MAAAQFTGEVSRGLVEGRKRGRRGDRRQEKGEGEDFKMIETCSFGLIVIDGKKYTSDLIIYPDGDIADYWRRKSGHRLSSDDIGELIKSGPEVIIAGTGVSGLMKSEKELEGLLHKKNIRFYFRTKPESNGNL